jgi:hypothetical protein
MPVMSRPWKGKAIIVTALIVAIACGVVLWARSLELRRTEEIAATRSDEIAKILGYCCEQYAIDHGGNYPPNLEVLVPIYLADIPFQEPFKAEELNRYKYHAGLKNTSPPDSILIEYDSGDYHLVVYSDDSTKVFKTR